MTLPLLDPALAPKIGISGCRLGNICDGFSENVGRFQKKLTKREFMNPMEIACPRRDLMNPDAVISKS